jgi:hypothetical protein
MLGCRVQIGEESIWAEEGGFEYADLPRVDFTGENPWRRKYLEFVATLKGHFGDRVPVGQPILRGPSDMIAAMRGSSEMIFDFYDDPDDFRRLAERCTDFAIRLVSSQQAITGPFAGGYLIEQLGIWAPDRLARLQEDSSALFSPDLYTTLCSPGTGEWPTRFRTPPSTCTPRPCSSWIASSTSNRSAASRSTRTSATRPSRR